MEALKVTSFTLTCAFSSKYAYTRFYLDITTYALPVLSTTSTNNARVPKKEISKELLMSCQVQIAKDHWERSNSNSNDCVQCSGTQFHMRTCAKYLFNHNHECSLYYHGHHHFSNFWNCCWYMCTKVQSYSSKHYYSNGFITAKHITIILRIMSSKTYYKYSFKIIFQQQKHLYAVYNCKITFPQQQKQFVRSLQQDYVALGPVAMQPVSFPLLQTSW